MEFHWASIPLEVFQERVWSFGIDHSSLRISLRMLPFRATRSFFELVPTFSIVPGVRLWVYHGTMRLHRGGMNLEHKSFPYTEGYHRLHHPILQTLQFSTLVPSILY